MVTTTEQLHVTNITLTINLNLFEFLQFSPTKWELPPYIFEAHEKWDKSSLALLFAACEAATPSKNDNYMSDIFRSDIGDHWHLLLSNWMEPPMDNASLVEYPLGDKRIVAHWCNSLHHNVKRLMKFFQRIKYQKLSIMSIDDIDDQLYYEMDLLMHQEIPFKNSYLMTLEAIKMGVDPRLKLFEQLLSVPLPILNGRKLTEIEQQLMQKKLNPKFASIYSRGSKSFLDGLNISSYQVFNWAMAGVNELIHVSTNPVTKIYIGDFSYEMPGHSQGTKFTMHIDLKVPPKTKELTVEVRSLLVNRFDTLFYTLLDALFVWDDLLQNPYQIENARCEGTEEIILDQLIWEHMFHSFFNNYQHTSLAIESGRGSSVTLEPLHKYVLSLKTSTQFASNIDNCHNGTHKECNENCMNDHYKEKCNCYPWPLYYLNEQQNNMCSEPCKEAEKMYQQCHVHCEHMLKHPCNLYIFDIDQKEKIYDRVTYYDEDKLRPLFAFKIVPGVRNYPQIMEEYAMPRSILLSELGGQLDLWMGINVIGFIHLLVYLTKQIYYAWDPKSHTGRTIRSLFNKDKNTEQENEKEDEMPDELFRTRFLTLEMKIDQAQKKNDKQLGKLYSLIRSLKHSA